ncbi:HAMP domain-containing sensor histidine kinase [Nannocystis sp.]|uniref:sensor histidine kinase n=1 Tax=Nannocystis sp. TaxID=1962667 RepID=UPI0025CE5D92|nr:HAMP domain-containing sensor histidine kinase [Nannocystis sp.]
MVVIGQRIIAALERRVPEVLRGDLDTRRRSMMALGVAYTIAGFCVPLAGLIFVLVGHDDRLIGSINTLLTAGLALATGPLLRRAGLVWATSWLAALLFAGAVYALYMGGGVLSAFVQLFAVIAVLTTMIAGRNAGIVWAGLGVAAVLTIYLTGDTQELIGDLLRIRNPDLLAASTAITIIVVLTIFAVLSEATKRDAIVQIAAATRRLETLVQEEQRARDLASEAVAANAAKSAFLATMSHELRTPLNIILGYSELALEHLEARGDDDTAEDLRRVHDAGKHLLGLISDVLDLSRIEADRLELAHEAFDLDAMIREVRLGFLPLALRNEDELLSEVPPGLVVAGLDHTRVRQVLLNLVSNAIKFTRGGQVRITARRSDDERGVEIEVRDTGIGIPADKLAVIFLPFTQVDPTTTRRYEGSGLGLAISRRLCELMGGSLSVASTPGRGSSFTLRLPCS